MDVDAFSKQMRGSKMTTKPRRRLALVAALIAVVCSVAISSPASSAITSGPYVPCYNSEGGVRHAVKPRRCSLATLNGPGLWLAKLHWTRWNSRRAVARGTLIPYEAARVHQVKLVFRKATQISDLGIFFMRMRARGVLYELGWDD